MGTCRVCGERLYAAVRGDMTTLCGGCIERYGLHCARAFSDWRMFGMMSHAEMQTEMGLSQIPRFRNRLERDREVAAQITAHRLATLGDWREKEGNGRAA